MNRLEKYASDHKIENEDIFEVIQRQCPQFVLDKKIPSSQLHCNDYENTYFGCLRCWTEEVE